MGILYPSTGIDAFSIPSNPQTTTLSSAGSSTRDHPTSHADMGAAIVALESNAAPLAHDHSGTDPSGLDLWVTNKLDQSATHQNADTDTYPTAIHHTIGLQPFQAAAGNHAHDYNGPSIFNQPYIICTSTTRPLNPFPGLTIWETDTNCARVWSSFVDNTLVSGLDYEYLFNSNNSATSLDSDIFTQTYVIGNGTTQGSMGAPAPGNCEWHEGSNVTARCIAQAVVEGSDTFSSDQQELQFVTGGHVQGQFGAGGKGSGSKESGPQGTPSNDAYLRMSSDGQSYVRFAVGYGAVAISYTVSGYAGEAILGAVGATTNVANTTWLCKAIGNTYTLYSNGQPILSVVDYNNVVNTGADYRGWGIGMQACVGEGAQYNPNSVAQILVIDQPTYTTELTWQLLAWGAVPHLRASANFQQEIFVTTEVLLFIDLIFLVIEWDWSVEHFMNPEVSQTDITIQEAGHYNVHAAVAWNPAYASFDHSLVGITVNGQDIGANNWQFTQGFNTSPGFSQTQDMYLSYKFAKGDVIRVVAATNSNVPTYTYYATGPYTQTCYVELDFVGPPT